MTDVTKSDLDKAVNGLRIEWRSEITSQTRWLTGLLVAGFLAQFFATMGGVYAMVSLLKPVVGS